MRRNVLCFGDSNTYGVVPTLARVGGHRFAPDRRWPGVLKRQLGEGWDVIEEGHPGRTTTHDDPIEGQHKNGRVALQVALETHMPISLVILFLGTNDLKYRFGVSAGDIIDSVDSLIGLVRQSGAGDGGAPPAVLVVAPPPAHEVGRLAEMFIGAAEKSAKFPTLFGDLARRADVAYLDASTIIESSAVDGIHLDADAHRNLGTSLATTIRRSFPHWT